MSRNQFYLEEDIRKIARLECSGLAKNEIIKKLNRRYPEHSKQSWRNFIVRQEEVIAEAVEQLKRRMAKGEETVALSSDEYGEIDASSEVESRSARKPHPRRATNDQESVAASSPAGQRNGGMFSTNSNRLRPRPGKRALVFEDSEDDIEDDETRDQLESSPQSVQRKRSKQDKTPVTKVKSKPRASAPAGRSLLFQKTTPNSSTADPRPNSEPQRAQSLPPATAALSDEGTPAQEDSAPVATFTETQAHKFDAGSEDEAPLDIDFDVLEGSSDDGAEDESGEVAASLKPVTNSSGSNKKRAREQRGTSESPTKASPSKQDVFGKEQAREMLQPTKKASGSKVGWDSPDQTQRSRKLKSQHPATSSGKEKGKQKARVTAGSRRQDQVCEPGTNESELDLFTSILAFADEWSLTPVAAHHLAFRCSNDPQIMQLYMRDQRNVGKPLDSRERELLRACFWSARDDRELRPGSKGGQEWDRLEARSSVEAMQTRRNFLAMHK